MSEAATIYQVAEESGVSVRTVSRYLNDPNCVSKKNAALIVAAMEELQFRPSRAARALKGVRPNLIGVISDQITTSPDSVELIKGLQLAAKAAGKRLLIAECDGQIEEVPHLVGELLEHRVEALIFAAHSHRKIDPAQLGRHGSTPLILLNCYSSENQHSAIVPDDEQGAYDGYAHLCALGHRRIAVFELYFAMRASQLRRRGCIKAARDAGAPEPIFVPGWQGGLPTDEFAGIDALVEEAMSRHAPTAIFGGNDKMAARIIQSLHKRQIAVPLQVSVLGFDNHPMLVHATDPPLTSVRLPYLEMGMRAAQLAHESGRPAIERSHCDVVVRASVGAPALGESA